VLAVMLGVMTARLDMVVLGMAGVPVRAMGVMGRLLMFAGLMMPGGFAVMFCRVLVMFGGLVVMLHACMIVHDKFSRFNMKSPHGLPTSPDTMLTASRQLCCG
jgi:hypothetical protein